MGCLRVSHSAAQAYEEHVVVIDADTIPKTTPVKFGDQVTADHLIENADEGEDAELPINTVAVVILDRATQWVAAYPQGDKDRRAHH